MANWRGGDEERDLSRNSALTLLLILEHLVIQSLQLWAKHVRFYLFFVPINDRKEQSECQHKY